MTLQEFIRDSLTQILAGVAEAKSKDKRIAPWVAATGKTASGLSIADGTAVFLVDFDVAVTAAESTGGGSGSISIAQVFSVGASREASKQETQLSRITFSVPIRYNNMQSGADDVGKDAV